MVKPSDFFIGTVEFFAIVLPGAILTGLIAVEAPGIVEDLIGVQSGGTQVVIFFVAAYVLGQVVYAVATVLDVPFDFLRARGSDDPYLERVRRLVDEEQRSAGKVASASFYKWAEGWVRLHNSAGALEIDHLQAEAKFFRTLTVVLVAAGAFGVARAELWQALAGLGLVPFTFMRFYQKRRKAIEAAYRFFVMLKLE